ncbi:unnamed protein product [Gongylonema pulchrum]|uniref:Calpain_III domain-containing protein n=1 Tax=Gongylonema pulchrum TaxID=637853 RepID=A0A183EWM0_9BILA|nr:unnamed protein product [Gongylonema pulchrum]
MEKPEVSDSLYVPAGQFSFCIPLAGLYKVTLDACHKFDKPFYELRIPQDVPLAASATKFMISASVELNPEDLAFDDMELLIKSYSDEQIVPVTSSSANKLIFTSYLSYLDTVAPITLVPQSKTYLFNPTSHANVIWMR